MPNQISSEANNMYHSFTTENQSNFSEYNKSSLKWNQHINYLSSTTKTQFNLSENNNLNIEWN